MAKTLLMHKATPGQRVGTLAESRIVDFAASLNIVKNHKIYSVGFLRSKIVTYLGASPDGIFLLLLHVGDEEPCLLECKTSSFVCLNAHQAKTVVWVRPGEDSYYKRVPKECRAQLIHHII